ncbi:phospholipid/cholesterol/gamma-HCH transport system substrate-binding protein [Nocardioides thalensis]|uniref:Phospholipid/cholesterol/gamma-HCH transport system substrate-binding protein n=1 Tax=Nocardioides thalensis TaxID=1914755 RepID=A0A853BXC6_9ACTN|nr:MCE family protein [Nocardioides thalensis]NYI99723.1 phospholipid/cholesterol/gamma-HCH transport system substrate-binding protein [Nocardioides thalensis]
MRRPSLIRSAVALVLGSSLLAGCGFDVYELPLPGGADVGDDPIKVKVEFQDVLDLVPQSAVKVNDISVGRVESVDLNGEDYTAEVTLVLRNDTGLPDNAVATIRQTSLLGEKFVSLAPPATGATDEPLGDGDEIPLEDSGRNPEVEEVLGALSLILNGGGVAQLKTITNELNLALEGREDSARSVLTQVESLVSQLDDRKADIVNAIEALNELALSVRERQGSIDQALEELPSALDSIERQRTDLVRMLEGLEELGDVGVRVINQTKDATISSLRQLEPLLINLDEAGSAFVEAFHVFYAFPFVDDTIGRDPQVARNLHLGDYVNLSIDLDLDLNNLSIPDIACVPLHELPDDTPLEDLIDIKGLCYGVTQILQDCLNTRFDQEQMKACQNLPGYLLDEICEATGLLCGLLGGGGGAGGAGGGNGILGSDNPIGDLLDDLGLGGLGLGRTAPGDDTGDTGDTDAFDRDLGLFLGAPLTATGVGS